MSLICWLTLLKYLRKWEIGLKISLTLTLCLWNCNSSFISVFSQESRLLYLMRYKIVRWLVRQSENWWRTVDMTTLKLGLYYQLERTSRIYAFRARRHAWHYSLWTMRSSDGLWTMSLRFRCSRMFSTHVQVWAMLSQGSCYATLGCIWLSEVCLKLWQHTSKPTIWVPWTQSKGRYWSCMPMISGR